jgi:hypothetical protein
MIDSAQALPEARRHVMRDVEYHVSSLLGYACLLGCSIGLFALFF